MLFLSFRMVLSVTSDLILLPFISVALHESGTRNALVGPWLYNTEVYLIPFISTQDHTVAGLNTVYIQSMYPSCISDICLLCIQYIIVIYVISIIWRNWMSLKIFFSSYLPVDQYIFARYSCNCHFSMKEPN